MGLDIDTLVCDVNLHTLSEIGYTHSTFPKRKKKMEKEKIVNFLFFGNVKGWKKKNFSEN